MFRRSEQSHLLLRDTRPIQNALVLYQYVGSCLIINCGRQGFITNRRVEKLTYPQTDIVPQYTTL